MAEKDFRNAPHPLVKILLISATEVDFDLERLPEVIDRVVHEINPAIVDLWQASFYKEIVIVGINEILSLTRVDSTLEICTWQDKHGVKYKTNYYGELIKKV